MAASCEGRLFGRVQVFRAKGEVRLCQFRFIEKRTGPSDLANDQGARIQDIARRVGGR